MGQTNSKPERNVIMREINRDNEDYYDVHVYSKYGIQQRDKNEAFRKAIDLIESVGGEIREDHRALMEVILYTLPPGVKNPIDPKDPQYKGRVFTKLWRKRSGSERAIFQS